MLEKGPGRSGVSTDTGLDTTVADCCQAFHGSWPPSRYRARFAFDEPSTLRETTSPCCRFRCGFSSLLGTRAVGTSAPLLVPAVALHQPVLSAGRPWLSAPTVEPST